jgi:hypothetical protein
MSTQAHKSNNMRYVQSKKVIQREVAGETVLVPIAGGCVDLEYLYRLNDVGAAVWQALDAPTTLNSVIDNVCNQFQTDDYDPRDIPGHIRLFIDELHEAGLVDADHSIDKGEQPTA